MQWLATVAHEVFGLFVDDGSFALAILVWIGIVWFASLHMGAAIPEGVIFFIGLAAILFVSALRSSKKA